MYPPGSGLFRLLGKSPAISSSPSDHRGRLVLLCRSRGKFYVTRFLPECPRARYKEIFRGYLLIANSLRVAV